MGKRFGRMIDSPGLTEARGCSISTKRDSLIDPFFIETQTPKSFSITIANHDITRAMTESRAISRMSCYFMM